MKKNKPYPTSETSYWNRWYLVVLLFLLLQVLAYYLITRYFK